MRKTDNGFLILDIILDSENIPERLTMQLILSNAEIGILKL